MKNMKKKLLLIGISPIVIAIAVINFNFGSFTKSSNDMSKAIACWTSEIQVTTTYYSNGVEETDYYDDYSVFGNTYWISYTTYCINPSNTGAQITINGSNSASIGSSNVTGLSVGSNGSSLNIGQTSSVTAQTSNGASYTISGAIAIVCQTVSSGTAGGSRSCTSVSCPPGYLQM